MNIAHCHSRQTDIGIRISISSIVNKLQNIGLFELLWIIDYLINSLSSAGRE